MRFKNFTLLFLMGIFGLFTTNLFAQQDATIDPADIRWWIGEGENEVHAGAHQDRDHALPDGLFGKGPGIGKLLLVGRVLAVEGAETAHGNEADGKFGAAPAGPVHKFRAEADGVFTHGNAAGSGSKKMPELMHGDENSKQKNGSKN